MDFCRNLWLGLELLYPTQNLSPLPHDVQPMVLENTVFIGNSFRESYSVIPYP